MRLHCLQHLGEQAFLGPEVVNQKAGAGSGSRRERAQRQIGQAVFEQIGDQRFDQFVFSILHVTNVTWNVRYMPRTDGHVRQS